MPSFSARTRFLQAALAIAGETTDDARPRIVRVTAGPAERSTSQAPVRLADRRRPGRSVDEAAAS